MNDKRNEIYRMFVSMYVFSTIEHTDFVIIHNILSRRFYSWHGNDMIISNQLINLCFHTGCQNDHLGHSYTGNVSTSALGLKCLPWNTTDFVQTSISKTTSSTISFMRKSIFLNSSKFEGSYVSWDRDDDASEFFLNS